MKVPQVKGSEAGMKHQRLSTQPLAMPRSIRRVGMRVGTSMPAGKMVPIGVAGLLREDAVRKGKMRYSFEMHETAEILLNAVQVCVKAYFVPFLAFERFVSMDELNRSYAGTVAREGDDPIPFLEEIAFDRNQEFYKFAGIHSRNGNMVNSAYLEAYNAIWNFRAKNRSKELTERGRLDGTLAPAFWNHSTFDKIVPDFEQAKIDGEVALNIVNTKMPVRGIGTNASFPIPRITVRESGAKRGVLYKSSRRTDNLASFIQMDEDNPGFPDIFAELQDDGITVSLSNIELAKKTQAFAKLREKYQGHEGDVDDYLIDLLMQGISVPEQMYKQPMLLAEKRTVFGMSKRYASDAANLTESAVNGATFVDMDIRLPRMSTGGVIMVVAEAYPEQVWERQRDAFFHATAVEQLPDALRDELDPEKVDIVPNEFVDVDHKTPKDTFGYAPMNFQWNVDNPRMGGRFYRPEVDAAFDEDRQQVWAVETQNPTLGEDFYLTTQIHTKPFADQTRDPFDCIGQGALMIEGNTVFGHALHESTNDYQEVLAKAPQERIEKSAVVE